MSKDHDPGLSQQIFLGLRKFTIWIALVYVGLLVISKVLAYLPVARDDSDPPWRFSGVRVHTDHLTGCQYLSHPRGGLTPRMQDVNGKLEQVCQKSAP